MKKTIIILSSLFLAVTAQAQYLLGDVNRDGQVNVTDVTATVDIILKGYLPFSVSPTKVNMSAEGGRVVDLITNGDLEGSDNSCFYVRQGVNSYFQSLAITDGIGVDDSRALMIETEDNPVTEWDSGFAIRLPEGLSEGEKFHIEFDYRASAEANIYTQSHGEPGDYYYWNCFGQVSFTTEWQHLSKDVTVSAQMAGASQGANAMQSIVFNLSSNEEATQFFFDNIKVDMVKDKEDIITNGDMEGSDVSCFLYRNDQTTYNPTPATIYDRVGVDGSRAVMVEKKEGQMEEWETQFFIRFPEALPKGAQFHIEFDYKASKEYSNCEAQAHGEPGEYHYYNCFVKKINFTTEWQHFEEDVEVSSAMAVISGFRSIAFNLAKNTTEAIQFFFDNIKVEVKGGDTMVDIIGGYNQYEVVSSDPDVVQASVRGKSITLKAVSPGEASVSVQDVPTLRYVSIPVSVR